ncbi:MAG: hypothetical protein Q9205_003250 [Flavoplaca limonia]
MSRVGQAHTNPHLGYQHLLPCSPSAESSSSQDQCGSPVTRDSPSWCRRPSSALRASAELQDHTSFPPNLSSKSNPSQEESQGGVAQLAPLECTCSSTRSPNPSPQHNPGPEETQGGVALLSPFEVVYDDVDDDFGRKVCEAYLVSQSRQRCRENNYGVDVAREWKKGSTPTEAREARETELQRRWEALSDSSEDDRGEDCDPNRRPKPKKPQFGIQPGGWMLLPPDKPSLTAHRPITT